MLWNIINNSYLSNIDSDFFLALTLCFIVIVVMNIVFWSFKPIK